ncbi:hypothetical protein CspeluHIS016_0504750 [Cutaneotrichosporon spelunceum]|uniref:Uncharacterized protein n=1 Tax=Cutaneotrichosporon spelunceum TaxID=1672016 RepID=A0AAD3TXA4_9TREE|nr:hypothetical protein CspeluHIS016_0504750 [Cutaneotrichosporon spelunceum]
MTTLMSPLSAFALGLEAPRNPKLLDASELRSVAMPYPAIECIPTPLPCPVVQTHNPMSYYGPGSIKFSTPVIRIELGDAPLTPPLTPPAESTSHIAENFENLQNSVNTKPVAFGKLCFPPLPPLPFKTTRWGLEAIPEETAPDFAFRDPVLLDSIAYRPSSLFSNPDTESIHSMCSNSDSESMESILRWDYNPFALDSQASDSEDAIVDETLLDVMPAHPSREVILSLLRASKLLPRCSSLPTLCKPTPAHIGTWDQWAKQFYQTAKQFAAARERGARLPLCDGCCLTRGKTIAKSGANIGCVVASCPNASATPEVPNRKLRWFATEMQVYQPLPKYRH